MKIKLLALIIVSTTFTIQAQIKTPQLSPTTKIEQKVGLTDITLEYSRPSKRGRIIVGDLVPYGKKWRTGANANTKITFSTNVVIDGKTLKKGTYAIYTIPNKNSWEVFFYNDATNWGLPKKWDDSKVALKTKVNVRDVPNFIETFTISFDNLADLESCNLTITWENVAVPLKISVPTEKIAMKSIEKVMAGPSSGDYFSAASYYYDTGKNKKQALKWVDEAIKMNPEAFWMYRKKSMIQADLGNKKGAITTAKISMDLAQKAGNDDYVKMNRESIAMWSK